MSLVAALAMVAPAARGGVVIDPAASTHTAWTWVALRLDAQPSGFFRLPVPPGTPDGGLPVRFDHAITYPGIVPFPSVTSGTSTLYFNSGLTRWFSDELVNIALEAVATASFTPGVGSDTPGYASGRARVALRLTSAPGTRLRVSATGEQSGALCVIALTGTHEAYRLEGTGAVQETWLFADGVCDLEWIVHAEVRTDPLERIDARRAAGSLRLDVEEVPAPGAVFSVHPAATVVAAGSPVTLSSEATAPAPITYQWTCDGQPIAGATGPVLVLPSVQPRHAGNYAVVATSEGVVVASQAAALTVEAPATSAARLLNLSTRGHAATGEAVLIPGFVIGGTQPKRLLIRAVGPTLGGPAFGVAGVLGDPRLTLLRREAAGDVVVVANDDWGDSPEVDAFATAFAQVQAFSLASPAEAALLVDLPPGRYTAIADGVDGATGVAIVEIYDLDTSATDARLVNLSTRGRAGVGAQVMIPGFVVSPEGAKTVLIRVVGPRLAAAPFGIADAMVDPELTVFRRVPGGGDVALFSSDDWGDASTADEIAAASAQVGAFALAPGSQDAALVATLAPGVYTVVGAAADGVSSGIVLVELYVLP